MMNILVLGVGNILMGDDGIGVRVIEHLDERYRFTEEVTLLDGGTLGLSLLPNVQEAQRLIIVDAMETGAPAGTIIRLAGEEIPPALETKLSPHQLGLRELLTVATLLDSSPEEVILLGVQPQSVQIALELSPPVKAQLEPLAERVLQELSGYGVTPIPPATPHSVVKLVQTH
jgi:hydrogenase maturation protease